MSVLEDSPCHEDKLIGVISVISLVKVKTIKCH